MKKLRKILTVLMLTIGLGLASCVSSKDPTKFPKLLPELDIAKANINTDKVQTGMVNAATQIDQQTVNIRRQAARIEEVLPPKEARKIEPQVDNIRENVQTIDKQTAEIRRLAGVLEQSKTTLDIAADKVERLNSQLDTAVKERDEAVKAKLESEAREKDGAQKLLRWLIVLCVIGGGAGIALMVYGQRKTGALVLAGAGSTLALAITVSRYFDYIAMGGLGVIAICVGLLVWQVFVRTKALEQTVETTEVAKRRLSPEDRKDVFGFAADPGIAYNIQSSSTETLIASIRKKLKDKYEHVFKDPTIEELEKLDRELIESKTPSRAARVKRKRF